MRPMQKQRGIYKKRLESFLNPSFNSQQNINNLIVMKEEHRGISLQTWTPPSPKEDLWIVANKQGSDEWKTFKTTLNSRDNDKVLFGPMFSSHWFKITIDFSKEWADLAKDHEILFYCNVDGEALVWSKDGEKPVHGLSPSPVNRHIFPLILILSSGDGNLSEWADKKLIFMIQFSCSGVFGVGDETLGNLNDGLGNVKSAFSGILECSLRVHDKGVLDVMRGLKIMKEMVDVDLDGPALFEANRVMDTFYANNQNIEQCLSIINEFLYPTQDNDGSGGGDCNALSSTFSSCTEHKVFAIGNCHIDTAWLWTFAETRKKTARSWSSQISLMRKYPNYKFAVSQMQQLEWLRVDYPELFRDLLYFHGRGQFIVVGGSWVEMDGNLLAGESFARQLYWGQKWMLDWLGSYSNIFWLPDTFGYSPQLPQILKMAQMPNFISQKLSWNNINAFPHSTFWWRALDGHSRVLAHFPPANTYTSMATLRDCIATQEACKDRDRTDASALLFGYGDGGGGPTEEMLAGLEIIQRSSRLPSIKLSTPTEFFEHLREKKVSSSGDSDNNPLQLSTWTGELYLELHRGTYTSQAKTKYYNRHCELLLCSLEQLGSLLLALYSSQDDMKKHWPYDRMQFLWKQVLLCQFHDVLPGSSIGDVYRDSDRIHEQVVVEAVKIRGEILSKLLEGFADFKYGNGGGGQVGEDDCGKQVVFINTTCFDRDTIIIAPWNDGDGDERVDEYKGVILLENIKAYSMVKFDHHHRRAKTTLPFSEQVRIVENTHPHNPRTFTLSNKYISLTIDHQGHFTSLIHKASNRECIGTGKKMNEFWIYDDQPTSWDAWDVEMYHLECGECVDNVTGLQIVEEGPLRCTIERTLVITSKNSSPDKPSKIVQAISLDASSSLLSLTQQIEWYQKHRLLKLQFPTNILSERVRADCAFGHTERSTHWNHSWQSAKFEQCAHTWIDLSDPMVGCALINDCKYGHYVEDSTIAVSLLRAPTMPDPSCDQGEHVIRLGLFIHDNFKDGGINEVVKEATHFNSPLLMNVSPCRLPDDWFDISFTRIINCYTGHQCIHITTIKPMEPTADTCSAHNDGNVKLIVRGYECEGAAGWAHLKIHPLLDLMSVQKCDLLEEIIQGDTEGCSITDDGEYKFKYRSFEIICLKITVQLKQSGHRGKVLEGDDVFII